MKVSSKKKTKFNFDEEAFADYISEFSSPESLVNLLENLQEELDNQHERERRSQILRLKYFLADNGLHDDDLPPFAAIPMIGGFGIGFLINFTMVQQNMISGVMSTVSLPLFAVGGAICGYSIYKLDEYIIKRRCQKAIFKEQTILKKIQLIENKITELESQPSTKENKEIIKNIQVARER